MRFSRMLTTIDAHAGGEPLRIVTAGVPPFRGATILERRAEMREHHDHLRRVLMWEPRGHADMYGAILTPPVTPGATTACSSCTTRATARCAATASSR